MPRKCVKHTVTPESIEAVKMMASFGLTQEQMAKVLGISYRTFKRKYVAAAREGLPFVINAVASSLYQTAMDRTHRGHVSAAIFLLKTRAGWRDVAPPETSVDLPPLNITIEPPPPDEAEKNENPL